MRYLKIDLDITPSPKGRPRTTKRGHTYTPKKTRNWEAQAKLLILSVLGSSDPFDCPVRVTVVFVCPRPKKAHSGVSSARYEKHTRPDLDNLLKSLLDAASLAEVWTDDSRVTQIIASKVYAAEGERPHIELEVEELNCQNH